MAEIFDVKFKINIQPSHGGGRNQNSNPLEGLRDAIRSLVSCFVFRLKKYYVAIHLFCTFDSGKLRL